MSLRYPGSGAVEILMIYLNVCIYADGRRMSRTLGMFEVHL